MNIMKLLVFPTRYYPAISGGDFFAQRIAEEFHKKWKPQVKVSILTSNAIDFSALHQQGKSVSPSHKNYSNYHGLPISRYKVEPHGGQYYQELLSLWNQYLGLGTSLFEYFFSKGPILPDLHPYLNPNQLGKSRLKSDLPVLPFADFDMIHTTYLPYFNVIYALFLGKVYHIPTLITPFLHYANVRYQDTAIFQVLAQFDGIHVCTETEKNLLITNGIEEKRIFIIPMGVDRERFTKKDYSSQFITRYGVQHPIILFCGYKNNEKGALGLLKAISAFPKETQIPNFVFIGPSTTAFNYELKKVRDHHPNTTILNITPENLSGIFDKNKIGAFQACDIYCMPSQSEAYGIAYLEAWACKKPVIAADIPAMHDVVTSESGCLVTFNDEIQIAETIAKLLASPEDAKRRGEHGFELIQTRNDWHKIVNRIYDFYLYTRNYFSNRMH